MDHKKEEFYKDNYVIRKNILGYYEVANKPSEVELNNFYSEKLYQSPTDHSYSYKMQYRPEELTYIENKSKKIYEIVKNVTNKTLLDVGCGEGYVSRFFFDLDYKIKALDYSSFAVKNHNSKVCPFFIAGDVFKNLDLIIESKEKYGIIILNNVIEHVLNPKNVLKKIHNILADDGILVITAPNDFSCLQKELLRKKYIYERNWLAPPMHLSYFNLETLSNLVEYCGYNIFDYYAEYPIDFDLLVDYTNYVNNKDVGKYSHLKRLRIDNFLCNQSISKVNTYYKSLADLGAGRDIVIFVKCK